jgi:hypothetical protein
MSKEFDVDSLKKDASGKSVKKKPVKEKKEVKSEKFVDAKGKGRDPKKWVHDVFKVEN